MGHRLAVLRDGRLQQLATPMEIYSRPENLFVAAFIGNPPMNQIEAAVDRERGRFVTCRGWLQLTAAQRDRIAERQRVILGIRPEHAQVKASSNAGSDVDGEGLELEVDVVEALGSDTYVTSAGGLRARLPHDLEPSLGDRLTVSCRPDQVHVFDTDSGMRLQ